MSVLGRLVCVVVAMSTLSLGQAQYKVLWSFGSIANDGTNPVSNLTTDSAGNLYGTTAYGGSGLAGGESGLGGTVFELSPQSDGTWSETILYNFCSLTGCADGQTPMAGLVLDAEGNLYGTTQMGGIPCPRGGSCGVVFELSPPLSSPAGTAWTENVLYNFCSLLQGNLCVDGDYPFSQLIFDTAGNLYGTTSAGGSSNGGGDAGVAFELSPRAKGWEYSVLYNFCSLGGELTCPDGLDPRAGMAFDKVGNLYGTTKNGGRYKLGIVYELTPSSGGWSEKILNSFYQLGNSEAPVSFDSFGNLYGTTLYYAFQLNGKTHTQGARPFTNSTGESFGGVLVDASRNALFGTGQGGIWEVNPARQLETIYSFCSQPSCADGTDAEAGLVEDTSGNLYGTTKSGGTANNGVVFEITP
ncbi:MAG: choice-of-anchor tandem repeat GloVer-containing protein [Terriglobales bacterium]